MVSLTKKQIDSALPKLARSIDKYLWIQDNLHKLNVASNSIFQKKFNSFYRVRRSKGWRKIFYNLFQEKKTEKPEFRLILFLLYKFIERHIEASFASKMVATINPEQPIIDNVVLKNLRLKLPTSGEKGRRMKTIRRLYENITKFYIKFLASKKGKYLVVQFKKAYPKKKVSKMKILDFVLWQTRILDPQQT